MMQQNVPSDEARTVYSAKTHEHLRQLYNILFFAFRSKLTNSKNGQRRVNKIKWYYSNWPSSHSSAKSVLLVVTCGRVDVASRSHDDVVVAARHLFSLLLTSVRRYTSSDSAAAADTRYVTECSYQLSYLTPPHLMSTKGGNLQLMLGWTESDRRKAPKNFLVPQKIEFWGDQCSPVFSK